MPRGDSHSTGLGFLGRGCQLRFLLKTLVPRHYSDDPLHWLQDTWWSCVRFWRINLARFYHSQQPGIFPNSTSLYSRLVKFHFRAVTCQVREPYWCMGLTFRHTWCVRIKRLTKCVLRVLPKLVKTQTHSSWIHASMFCFLFKKSIAQIETDREWLV